MSTLTKEDIGVLQELIAALKSDEKEIVNLNTPSVNDVQRLGLIQCSIALYERAIATAAAYDELKAKYEALRAKVPDGWEPVTFERGKLAIDRLKNGEWIAENPSDLTALTEAGEWSVKYGCARFSTPTEAAKAAEKAGEQ